jgi:hypothetical protein
MGVPSTTLRFYRSGTGTENISAAFPVRISYVGSWNASWKGYYYQEDYQYNQGFSPDATGDYHGSGPNSTTITLHGYGLTGPVLCVSVAKMDPSNNPLVVSILQSSNSTSSSFGLAKICVTLNI